MPLAATPLEIETGLKIPKGDEVLMTKKETGQYQAKVANDNGIVRGKIPSPLLRVMGARPGNYVVFNWDGENATMRVVRSKGTGKLARSGVRKTGIKRN
jgi:hypothetical protein